MIEWVLSGPPLVRTGTPPHWKPFVLQLAEWTFAVVLSRVLCGLVVSHMASQFASIVLCEVWKSDQQGLAAHMNNVPCA